MRVRDALLALLARGPAHGYQLKRDYERLTGNPPINIGQIYQTLERLQRDGRVEREDGEPEDRRITYHLTDDGQADAEKILFAVDDHSEGRRSPAAVRVLLATGIPGVDALEVLDA